MMLTEELYKKLYGFEMIREPGNPYRIDTPIMSIEDLTEFVDKCGGKKPAFMSIYSYEEPYKVTYDTNNNRHAEYIKPIFDRIALDFDIDKLNLLKAEGYTTEDIRLKGEELLKAEGKAVTKKSSINKGRDYYLTEVKERDAEAIKTLTKGKPIADRHDIIMQYYYEKYTSSEFLIEPYKEAIKVAEYIKSYFGIEPLLFFSGGHGVHLYILFNPVDIPNIDAVVNEFGTKLEKGLNLKTLDDSVIQAVHQHLLRIPLSRHQNTNLYVTPFDTHTSYFEVMDNAVAPNININLDKYFNQDTSKIEEFLKEYSVIVEEKSKDNNRRKINLEDVKYTLNGSVFDLQEPFSRIYQEGHRNIIGHRLIHLFCTAEVPKKDCEKFFETLDTNHDLNKVQSWINRVYDTPSGNILIGDMGYFVNGVKEYADTKEDADYIIKKFNQYFNPNQQIKEIELEPFTIGTDARKYDVTAILINGKYTEIQIKELFDNKHFCFIFDIANNVCKLVYGNDMRFEFKYTFNPGGFKIKSKEEFKTIRKDISEILGIKIPDAFQYSLSSYLSDLYDEIDRTNIAEVEAEAEAIDIDIDSEEIINLIHEIRELFEERSRTSVEKGRRQLSLLLSSYYGVILRKYMGTIYKINGNGYEPTSHDDLINEMTKIFGKNFIHDNDLKNAIGYISDRLEPIPNVIKFKNTLFDMNSLQPIESDKPIFTVLNIPYNYNPNAKSSMFENFLITTFERDTAEATAEAVKGIKQLCGYLFTSGNSLEILPIFTGLTGAGKSTLLNIITGIFGKDKISGISLQNLENDIHASSGFIGKHLNIIRDSDVSVIKNNSILKTWTGNEAYSINPKFKELFDLPADEVPKPILACNTMPVFKVYDDAVIRRFVIVEFLVSMTKQGKAIKDLDKKILADAEEVEWFIYESIQAYKEMIESGDTFVFKISDEKTKELIEKHTHPLNHIVRSLIEKHDPQAYDEEKAIDLEGNFTPIFTDDLVDAILFVSEDKGIDVPVNKHGKIDKKMLLEVIRDEYDLHDGEIVKNNNHDSKNYGKYSFHRDYKAKNERFNGLNKKCYPNLIATPEYTKIMKQVEKKRKQSNND